MPTEPQTIGAVLEMLASTRVLSAETTAQPLFADLGSGDGRVVVAAAKRFPHCRCVGVDCLPDQVNAAKVLCQLDYLDPGRVAFACLDMGVVDLTGVDAIFMYVPRRMAFHMVEQLLPRSNLRPGAVVIIEDAPEDVRKNFGLKHLRRGGVLPHNDKNPSLDLFEWQGVPAHKLPPIASEFFSDPEMLGASKVQLQTFVDPPRGAR